LFKLFDDKRIQHASTSSSVVAASNMPLTDIVVRTLKKVPSSCLLDDNLNAHNRSFFAKRQDLGHIDV
jgi:hypothetical protein